MKRLKFKKMDAFTDGTANGNPAGCIYLGSDTVLSADEMQRIAWKLKGFVSEVGFLSMVEDKYMLKYYSADCEVDFCGHATIAITYDLISENADLRQKKEISIHVNAGELSVFNHLADDDSVFIMAPQPQFLPAELSSNDVAKALGINSGEIDQKLPISIIYAGLRTLIVPLTALENILGVKPNQEQLRQFSLDNDFDITLIFSPSTALPTSNYRTRVFAPRFGYLEDPATGSGNAAFGHYLIKQGLGQENIIIEQGPSKDVPNIVKLRKYQKDNQDYILFGGASVLRIDGEYLLQDI